jgi:hypothetical protein
MSPSWLNFLRPLGLSLAQAAMCDAHSCPNCEGWRLRVQAVEQRMQALEARVAVAENRVTDVEKDVEYIDQKFENSIDREIKTESDSAEAPGAVGPVTEAMIGPVTPFTPPELPASSTPPQQVPTNGITGETNNVSATFDTSRGKHFFAI